ncbi:MAG: hypothetical protein ACYTGV_14535 [Planctomycetota bacterium]
MRATIPAILGLLLLTGCDRSGSKRLEDLTWGKDIEGSHAAVVSRAKNVLHREFPKGLDPTKMKEAEQGDLYTVWHYEQSVWYRETKRIKGHIKVEKAGKNKVRVGVCVFSQISDNIDNPHSIEEARWVRGERDVERAKRIYFNIARPYTEVKPSEYWEERHRTESSTEMRKDIVDRTKDVDLEELDRQGAQGERKSSEEK